MQAFADALEERSGGVLQAEIFDSSQLYNARDVGRAVARGDVAMATVPSPYLSRVESSINVLDLPMLSGLDEDQRSAMLDGALGQRLSAPLSERMGVVVPGNWPLLGRVYYWSTSNPLTNFDEYVGLQVRIPGGAAPAARVAAMGGVPVVMPGSDMPLALQQGKVDATMGSIESVVQQRLTDVGVQYGFWDQGIVGYLIPIVSQDYWNSLNDDQQALFTEVWNEMVAGQRAQAIAQDADPSQLRRRDLRPAVRHRRCSVLHLLGFNRCRGRNALGRTDREFTAPAFLDLLPVAEHQLHRASAVHPRTAAPGPDRSAPAASARPIRLN